MNGVLELNELDREFFRQCGIAIPTDAEWPDDIPVHELAAMTRPDWDEFQNRWRLTSPEEEI